MLKYKRSCNDLYNMLNLEMLLFPTIFDVILAIFFKRKTRKRAGDFLGRMGMLTNYIFHVAS